MKIETGNITRRDLLVGSAAAGGLAMLGSPAVSFAQAASSVSPANASQLDGLAALLRGDLITPGNDRYDESRKVWNGMIDKYPAAIARCSGVADVMNVVKFARDEEIAVSVRGDGHNVTGKSITRRRHYN